MSAAELCRPFAVMIKPVGSRCNMRCRYCYYLDKGRFSSHPAQTVMRRDLLEKLIRQAVDSTDGNVISFTWHGGEPTLAGIDFYRQAVSLEKKYCPRGKQIWNNLQTNGLLINDQWVRFLKENHFDVGLSIDGTEAVHDANRPDPAGGGTWSRVRKAAERLTRAGILPDLLCTVNAKTVTDPVGVYRSLADLGTGWIQFIPVVVRNGNILSDESVSADSYGNFLIAVFDEWARKDLGKLDIQLFAETAKVLAGGEPSLCWMRGTCGQVPVVEEDGAVYSCDHFVDDAHRLGCLHTQKLKQMALSEYQDGFGRSKADNLTAQCCSCPYLRFCGGGCPKDRFGISDSGENGQYILCSGLKKFWDHAVPVLKWMMQKSRSGCGPDEIMALLD